MKRKEPWGEMWKGPLGQLPLLLLRLDFPPQLRAPHVLGALSMGGGMAFSSSGQATETGVSNYGARTGPFHNMKFFSYFKEMNF